MYDEISYIVDIVEPGDIFHHCLTSVHLVAANKWQTWTNSNKQNSKTADNAEQWLPTFVSTI